ncbi:MAG: exopolyphosphatase, partial [Bacteroidetes bacterium]|nr:exopolyphosphatase [Bacteroidota bacterium]
ESFNIGTIRLLQNTVSETTWDSLRVFLKTNVKNYAPIEAIGSGGNINKIFSLSKRKEGKPLPIELLKEYYKELSFASIAERKHFYGFRDDRADVIVPALQIYISIMRWVGATEVYVPKIGLSDGIVRMLYKENVGV